MPITGPASYLPTADEFIAHWTAADSAPGGSGPIILLQGVSLAGLTDLRNRLESARAEVESLRNAREMARAAIEEGKSALLARLGQFKLKIRSLAPDSRWERALPKAFAVSESFGKVIPPLDELADLWRRYEAEAGNLQLMGHFSRQDLNSALTALKAAYTELTAAGQALSLARGQRGELEGRIHAVLKAYRQRIPAEFPEGDPVLETLPRLTPAQTGSAPEPVRAGGVWNPATSLADLSWTASADSGLARYEVRAVAGPEYEEEDETPVAVTAPRRSPGLERGLRPRPARSRRQLPDLRHPPQRPRERQQPRHHHPPPCPCPCPCPGACPGAGGLPLIPPPADNAGTGWRRLPACVATGLPARPARPGLPSLLTTGVELLKTGVTG